MKIYLKRLLTMLVVVFMLFASAVPTTVFADADDNSDSTGDMYLSDDSEGLGEPSETDEAAEPEKVTKPEEPDESDPIEEIEELDEASLEPVIQGVVVQGEEELFSAESYETGEVGGVVGENDPPQDPGEGEGTENEGPDETVTLDVQDGDDITAVLKSTLNRAPLADDGVLTIIIKEGSYTITQDLPVFSNTTIIATGATITALHDDGSMMWGAHKVDGSICRHSAASPCEHGGYTQNHDITIDGGTWIRDANEEFTVNKTSILGFRHGENLTIKNATFEKAADHFLNLSGMRNVEVSNCKFKNALQFTSPASNPVWSSHKKDPANRFNTIEAVHFDYCSPASESSDRAAPQDGTAPQNVTVKDCQFTNVHSGVGTHHPVDMSDENPNHLMAGKMVIENCMADTLHSYFVYAGDFEDVQILNNTINNGNGLAFIRATDSNVEKATATITGNELNTRSSFEIILKRDNKNEPFDKSFGIKVMNATVNITSNKFYNTGQTGIYTENSKITATKNTISAAGNMGINIKNNSSATCTSNTITNAANSGIKAETGSTLTATSNTISGSANMGVYVDGASATVQSNTISDSGNSGIKAESGERLTAKSNKITNSGVIYTKGKGVYATGSKTVTIQSNTISGTSDDAVTIDGCTKFVGNSNTISGAGVGGIIVTSTPSTIDGNKIQKHSGSNCAIKVTSSKSTITNNTISSTAATDALVVLESNNSVVRGNKITASGKNGIRIWKTKSATVTSNNVSGTASHALLVDGAKDLPSSEALISNNTLYADPKKSGKDLRLGAYAIKCIIEPNTLKNKRESYDSTSSHTTIKKGTLKSEVKDGQYYYDGYKNNTFTGLAPDAAGKYLFVRKGKFEKFTGLAISIKDDKYYFAKDGKYDKTFTGLAQSAHAKGYYFVRAGKYDKTFTGLALSAHAKGYYFARNGKYDAKFTGLAQSIKDNKYYYAKNGKYDNTFTGIATSATAKGQYYVVKGAWNKKFTGKVKYNKKTYNVVKGVVK